MNRGRAVRAVTASLILLAACSGGSSDGSSSKGEVPPRTTTTRAPRRAPERTASAAAAGSPHRSCDPISGADIESKGVAPRCVLPFPNDYFTQIDKSTETGLRVALDTRDMPKNVAGNPIDVAEQDRNDGFSPGSALLLQAPGIDLAATGAAPITDIGASLDDDAPVVLVDLDTGQRHPYWVEPDSNTDVEADRLLLIRPATNFLEGHRYAVGLRNIKGPDGSALAPPESFRLIRDGSPVADAGLKERTAGVVQVLDELEQVGVDRADLYLAWDFTIASERSLSERLLHMRDDGFEQLGDKAPGFKVEQVEDAATQPDSTLLRTVTGTFDVPRYLTGDGTPGTMLNNGSGVDDPLPARNGTQTANFVCTVPRTAVGADGVANPTRSSLYGHGLLGAADQVKGVGNAYGKVSNTTFCATDWIGLSEGDIANAVATLGDLSKFRTMADRMQQGMLDFLFLGRLMKSPEGLTTDPAFQDGEGRPLLDHENLVFVGLSQGGIMGGATTAVAQDWDRALLGVPGANYGLLLNRSVDFDTYSAILDPAYPSAADRQIGLQLIQMLWDRGENNGYSQHFTRHPYPGTGSKQFLLFEAFGDHQVANISTEVMARTMGVELRQPPLRKGRSTDVDPFFGIDPIKSLPAQGGSYLVVWDFGTPAPPLANLPNRAGEDPHGKGRDQKEVLTLGSTFLESGRLVDVCDAKPCVTLDG